MRIDIHGGVAGLLRIVGMLDPQLAYIVELTVLAAALFRNGRRAHPVPKSADARLKG